MQRILRTGLITAGVLAVLAGERTALALQGGEDPSTLPVLIDKRYGAGGRHQLALFFSTPLVSKFVESTGGYLSYTYNFTDLIGAELGGGYFLSGESSIMDEVRAATTTEPLLSGLYQMVWAAQADVVLTPLYGKISFASELDPAFDLYILAGGGVAGTRRKQTGGPDLSKTTPAFNAGFGFHFFFNRLIGIRVELRDFFYPEPDPNNGGITANLQVQAGLQLAFGGEG